jgi:transposase
MINQVLKLKELGHPIRKISNSLGISRNTVRRYIRLSRVASPISMIDEASGEAQTLRLRWMTGISWEEICAKNKRGITAKQLYIEYEPQVSYSRFCFYLRESNTSLPSLAPRLVHNPGEKIYIDFCDGIAITDRKTGKKRTTQLFAAVLPFSSYTFATFTWDQKLPSFLRCHEALWAWLGGVIPYVVVDNLKSGVKKAHRYDPDTNPTYCDYGNHQGFAVLPARPYTPRDKAAVESGIGCLQRSFYQGVHDQTFYSLEELNHYLRVFLDTFNGSVMKDYGVSRRDRFAVEREKLLPLPLNLYEICEWREAKVHPDCCIQVAKSFYSVPFRYVGQQVRVKKTDKLVEIFNQETQAIACHRRAETVGSVRVDEHHLPPYHQQSQCFDLHKGQARAKAVGANTAQLVELLFSDPRPLRYLRRVQGIFRLLDTEVIDRRALEYASGQALTFSRYQLSFIQSCAVRFRETGGRLSSLAPQRQPENTFLHGE